MNKELEKIFVLLEANEELMKSFYFFSVAAFPEKADFFARASAGMSKLISKDGELAEALSLAVEMENMMLEKSYFESLKTQSGEQADFLKRLAEATVHHAKEIEDALNKEKNAAR